MSPRHLLAVGRRRTALNKSPGAAEFGAGAYQAFEHEAEAQRKETLKRYPLEHWPEMTLQEYAQGQAGRRTLCSATSAPPSPAGCGSPASPTCAAGKAWCFFASVMDVWSAAGSSAGSSPRQHAHPRSGCARRAADGPHAAPRPAPTSTSCTTPLQVRAIRRPMTFAQVLDDHGVLASIGSVGDAYDTQSRMLALGAVGQARFLLTTRPRGTDARGCIGVDLSARSGEWSITPPPVGRIVT